VIARAPSCGCVACVLINEMVIRFWRRCQSGSPCSWSTCDHPDHRHRPGINPARCLGAAVMYNNDKAWSDQVYMMNTHLHYWVIVQRFAIIDWPAMNWHTIHAFCSSVQWIFWVGPFIGAAIAALYRQIVLRASARGYGSFRSNA
jgi:hypothetical protein